MTITETRPDTDSLEHLDFDETCRRCATPWDEPCGAKADWLVIKNCCGAHTFLCDPHLRRITGMNRFCLDCGSAAPMGPLKAWRI